MRVLLFVIFKHLLLRKTEFLKAFQKSKEMHLEEQKSTRYILENTYFSIIIFSCLLPTNPCLRFLLIHFVREIKGFSQSSFGKEVDFRDIMKVSQNILDKI